MSGKNGWHDSRTWRPKGTLWIVASRSRAARNCAGESMISRVTVFCRRWRWHVTLPSDVFLSNE